MFKETMYEGSTLFTSISDCLSPQKLKMFKDSNSWSNSFYNNFTKNIREDIFKVLYPSNVGNVNSSIKVLVGMLVIKEGFGLSDSQLYDNCSFHIRYMQALGLNNLDNNVPVASSYYLFKKRLVDYKEENGIDLMELMFEDLTKRQINFYGIDGERIRMDSKLIGSNIAKQGRLQLIISCIQKFCKNLSDIDKNLLSE